MSYYKPAVEATNDNEYTLYGKQFWDTANVVSIDNTSKSIATLVAKGETAMNSLLSELASVDPGQLDQSRLMSAQMSMTRWQMSTQLLTNMQSGVGTGLKNIVSNIGR